MGTMEARGGLGDYRGSSATKAEFEHDVNYPQLVSNNPGSSNIPSPRYFRLSPPLTLHICICSPITTEFAENQAKLLQKQTTEILQSSLAHSALPRELINRREEQARALEQIHASSPYGNSTTQGCLSDNRDNFDNASFVSKWSSLSFRLGQPEYMEDLKESRAYKRLRHFGREVGLSSDSRSVFSFERGCNTGNWSMLSDISLGYLSVSEIAVLNLPIDLADVSNPEPSKSQDQLSIATPRSRRRVWPPQYMKDLKVSRVYKRLRHFGLGVDSSAASVHSFEDGSSADKGSMLSDMTLEDLRVSDIGALNLPIALADVCNAEPFQEPGSSTGAHHSDQHPKPHRNWFSLRKWFSRRKRSSRGRIHKAIETGNGPIIWTLLALRMDIEELDSNGRTPLVHATMKRREGICDLLLDKGASVEALQAFTSGMDLKERSEKLDPLIKKAMDDGSTSVTVLKLLILMALGTSDEGDDGPRPSSQINVAINMNYRLAVRAIIQLNPQTLMEVDTRGRTPFVHAYELQRNAICEQILVNLALEGVAEDAAAEGMVLRLIDDAYAAIMSDCSRVLELQLAKDGSIVHAYDHLPAETNDRTRLAVTSALVYHTKIRELLQLATIFPVIRATQLELGTKLNGFIHSAIRQECPQVLEFLLSVDADIGLRGEDDQGRTPLAHAAYNCHDSMCHILLKAGAKREGLQKIGQRLSLKGCIHTAIDRRCKTSLDLLLEMGADVEEVDIEGRTPLVHVAQFVLTSTVDIAHYKPLDYICRVLLDNANTETTKMMAMACVASAVSMHDLVNKGYKSILQLFSLIEARDLEGWTPLASAAFNHKEALCQFLVKKHCNLCLDTEQKKQLKPKLSCRIHGAARSGNKSALKLLLDMGADINERDPEGGTALLGAVYYNHLSCVKMLIERGADATISKSSERTALHHAVWSGNEQIMKFLLDDVVETRKLVDVKDDSGDSALHGCSHPGHRSPAVCLGVAKRLVQAGASLTVKDKCGRTPYGRARDTDWGNKEVAKYLWSQLSPEQQAQEKPPPSDP